MSRNFEEEYREKMLSDIPDLWNRIEKNLPEKNVTPVVNINDTDVINKTEKAKIWILHPGRVKYLAGIAACAAVVLLAVPAVQLSKNSQKTSSYETPAVVQESNPTTDEAVNPTQKDTSVINNKDSLETAPDAPGTNAGGAAAVSPTALLPSADPVTEISDFQSGESESGVVSVEGEEEQAEGDVAEGTVNVGDAADSPVTKAYSPEHITEGSAMDKSVNKVAGVTALPALTYTSLPVSVTASRKSGIETIYTLTVSRENDCGLDIGTELLAKIADSSTGELKINKDYAVTLISDDTANQTDTKQIFIVTKIGK